MIVSGFTRQRLRRPQQQEIRPGQRELHAGQEGQEVPQLKLGSATAQRRQVGQIP